MEHKSESYKITSPIPDNPLLLGATLAVGGILMISGIYWVWENTHEGIATFFELLLVDLGLE